MLKRCSKCGLHKDISEFRKRKSSKDGYADVCKECCKAKESIYRKENKDRITSNRKLWEECNRDIIAAKRKEYTLKTKEQKSEYDKKYREENKERIRQQQKEYYEKNKDKLKEYKRKYDHGVRLEKEKERRENDKLYNFINRIRASTYNFLKETNVNKSKSTEQMLGCSYEDAMDYLEQTWINNYGCPRGDEAYHVDHIIPLSSAKTEEDVMRLCHISNLQMLKPKDNLQKHDKLDWALKLGGNVNAD